MTIDPVTGALHLDAGFLGPAVALEDFLAGPLADDATVAVRNEPWITYDVRVDEAWSMSVVFESGRLSEVRLVRVAPGETADWTEASELSRKRGHDAWLHEQLGDRGSWFSWGAVESIYDPKALCSYIVIRYNAGGED